MDPFLAGRVQQLWQLSRGPFEGSSKAIWALEEEAERAVDAGISSSKTAGTFSKSRIAYLQKESKAVLIARVEALYEYFKELPLDRDLTNFRRIPHFRALPALYDAVDELMQRGGGSLVSSDSSR